MTEYLTEKYRPRRYLKKIQQTIEIPNLLKTQKKSYDSFLYRDKENNVESGIEQTFKSIFPIISENELVKIEFEKYEVIEKPLDYLSCVQRGVTYEGELRANLKMYIYKKAANKGKEKDKEIKRVTSQDIYICNVPLMTETGSFVVNGTQRVIVSQLHRSPGVFFDSDKGKTHVSKKVLYTAKIIPYRGSWLDFEFDVKDLLYMRIDKKKKMPLTIILKALGYNNQQIIDIFYEKIPVSFGKNDVKIKVDIKKLKGETINYDIYNANNGELLIEKGTRINLRHLKNFEGEDIQTLKVTNEYLIGKILGQDIIDKSTGEVMYETNTAISEEILNRLEEEKIKKFDILFSNEINCGLFISDTLRMDTCKSKDEAIIDIYKVIRPGEPTNVPVATEFFENMFFNSTKYSLSQVGRLKLNSRLGKAEALEPQVLEPSDIVEVIKELVNIRNGFSKEDDIDSMANRRIRSVGEMVHNQFRVGLLRMEKNIKEYLTFKNLDEITLKELINGRPLAAVLKEFFGTGQLSQFMDQNNPLSEITHKRRVSALGPGGLSRERAGFEVRDVHPTHYGRVCPIETPEGQNIGLINSLASYAKVNQFGFIETPYRKVKNKKILDEYVFLAATEEKDHIIAQANSKTEDGKLADDLVIARCNYETMMKSTDEVDLIDISNQQMVSIAASMIPFLEHDDANRALMGSNMQRQAVPLLIREKPLVGTGMETTVARDSKVCVTAKRSGTVKTVDAEKIVIIVDLNEIETGESNIEIYRLVKYRRSNQNTCINQVPIVNEGDKVIAGDIIADGPAIDYGELALGQNIRVAFMSWNGFNFEDSILISEKLIKEDKFANIVIEEFSCSAHLHKQGKDEITNDIPNLNENQLANLDQSGIVMIGTEVQSGDILVGKITPKTEVQLSPEEKLMRAIFGEKASDVKDSSLRVPLGVQGKVIDVQIFTRDGVDKNERALEIEQDQREKLEQDYKLESILLNQAYDNLRKNLLSGKIEDEKTKKEISITESFLEKISNEELTSLNIISNNRIKKYINAVIDYEKHIKIKYEQKKKIISGYSSLPAGILQMVKVSIAVKKPLKVGDKLAGRHGNKGVLSAILPVEDMPYDENGEPVEMILNPLGVPSRMNVGQVIETHVGLVAKGIGDRLNKMIREQRAAHEFKKYLSDVYEDPKFEKMDDESIVKISSNLVEGVPMATPVFSGVSEDTIERLRKLTDLPESKKMNLFDGRTGDPFDQAITVGYMYILKLNHLVDDKMHARSTGSYSLVTQQPLGGKSQFGGQRLGEMEVWAMEAYGAAYTLQEMLTVKSDDIDGRRNVYKNIIENDYNIKFGLPESFNVLLREIRSIGLDIDLLYNKD